MTASCLSPSPARDEGRGEGNPNNTRNTKVTVYGIKNCPN